MAAGLRQRLWPRVPDTVRADLTLLRYTSLRAQIPMLYVMLVLLIAVTIVGTPAPADPRVAIGLPVVMMAVITLRLAYWIRRRSQPVTTQTADAMITAMTWSSCCIGALASLWGVTGWLTAPAEVALYYPMLLAMGALSAAFCVSNIRSETILNLGICLFPISAVMLWRGGTLDIAAGTSMLVAALFLMRLILSNHDRLVAQLMLEQRMRELAHTDELTGLLNRRALKTEMSAVIAAHQPLALILLDLDGFKAVNDQYGHGAGDDLLQEIGMRLCATAGDDAYVARLGGDEFALLLPGADQAAARALADRVLLSLVRPISLPAATVRIGASAGISAGGADASITMLFSEADGALYAAKRGSLPDLQRTLKRAPMRS